MNKRFEAIRSSLRNTEFFFIGILVFVILSISMLLMIYIPSVARIVSEGAEAEISSATLANSYTADTHFRNKMSFLEAAASEFRKIDTADTDKVLETVRSIHANSQFRHIGFTGTDGVTISSTGSVENTSNRQFIQAGISGSATVSPHVICDFDNTYCDMYTVPVYNGSGELIGALTGDDEQFEFTNIMLLGIAGDKSCYFIFDSMGDVIYCSPGNSAGIGPADNLLAAIDDEVVSKDIGFLLNSLNRSAVKRVSINGVEYIASFMGVLNDEWTFAAIVPAETGYSSFTGLVVFTGFLIAILSLLLIAALIIVAVRIRAVKHDVSDFVGESEQLLYTDSLTGGETIALFREKYAAAMADTASEHALISLDVDRFKAVNDVFGFEGGNKIIRVISDIIARSIGKNDFSARSSGDLFYICAEFGDKRELCELAERIMSDVEYQITEVHLSISIGIYMIDDKPIRSRVAADRADMARETAKNSKDSSYAFFDSSMLERIRREKRIEDIMEDSLALGEFRVYLQPKYSLGSQNEVVGAEALVRWNHDGRLIPPGDFIPLFERNGFVTKIDYYMFEEVCKLQKKYVSLGFTPKIISVNMSRLHIHKPGFVDELAAMCDKYGVETKYIEIEITESAAFENMETLREIFRQIKSKGFHVSIDDFGSGYSSLNMLKDMPVDVLKIDRSFLTEKADENEDASIIISCVVMLASHLDIHTICEGIETQVQADLLTKLGCEMAQGFFFARPMPVPDYEKLTYGLGEGK